MINRFPGDETYALQSHDLKVKCPKGRHGNCDRQIKRITHSVETELSIKLKTIMNIFAWPSERDNLIESTKITINLINTHSGEYYKISGKIKLHLIKIKVLTIVWVKD